VDLERNGIAYPDESGRYADLHALRYTWDTFLNRNGVAPRAVMKLMRHSDVKLTSKVYTDEMQLPIYDAIKDLPRPKGYTQIVIQISGGGAKGGSSWRKAPSRRMRKNPCKWRGLSHFGGTSRGK
jgi:hypothetical protein